MDPSLECLRVPGDLMTAPCLLRRPFWTAYPKFNIRTGLLLIPMGFINEIHEGPTFHGNYRPMVEQVIIPTTWREVGVGVWGQLADGLQ